MHVHFTLPRLGLGTLAIGLLWYAASSWLGIGKFSDIGKLLDPWRPTSSLIAEADANVGKAAQKIQKAALQVEGLDRPVQQEEAKLASARRSLETRKEELAIIHGHLKSSSGDSILVHANIKVSRKDAERDRSRLVQEISNLESMIAGSEKRLAELTAAKEIGRAHV